MLIFGAQWFMFKRFKLSDCLTNPCSCRVSVTLSLMLAFFAIDSLFVHEYSFAVISVLIALLTLWELGRIISILGVDKRAVSNLDG